MQIFIIIDNIILPGFFSLYTQSLRKKLLCNEYEKPLIILSKLSKTVH